MKPILFNTEMVKAILNGRKSVTRRVVKPPALDRMILDAVDDCIGSFDSEKGDVYPAVDDCRYQPSDILYVREGWTTLVGSYIYKADQKPGMKNPGKWRPSIHMPKEAGRLFLRVTNVRVERLQDITESQAEKEGCSAGRMVITEGPWGIEDDPDEWTARDDFSTLWDSTIKKADLPRYGWDANPWVWVIEFEKISKEEALAIETSR